MRPARAAGETLEFARSDVATSMYSPKTLKQRGYNHGREEKVREEESAEKEEGRQTQIGQEAQDRAEIPVIRNDRPLNQPATGRQSVAGFSFPPRVSAGCKEADRP